MNPSSQEWLLIAGLSVVALIAGLLTDALGWSLLAAASVWIAIQEHELRTLARWTRRTLSRPDNRITRWQDLSNHLYRSLKESRRRNARVLRAFRNMRVITDALPDAAIILDRHGHILNFNVSARETLNLAPADRGGNLAALIRQPNFVELLKGNLPDGLVEFASPFDEERRLEARRVAIEGGFALVLVRDVTQLNRLLTMRQDFVANVSHELRTPLTVVVGYLEALGDDELDVQTLRAVLAKLGPPTARMRALVDDLLLLSRLEASTPPDASQLDAVDVAALVRGCVSEARVLSEGRHRFETRVDSSIRLLGIESELYSAALNMLTNAVRYSPNGGTVTIVWEATPAGARLAVQDEGVGIAPEHLERITERFYRVDLAKSRVRGGTGLGLAIVKHVLKRHRSALQVESVLGRGSRFSGEFPAELLQLSTPNHQEIS